MKSIFSTSGLLFLESLAFTRTLFAFDFDGTVSRIARSPEDASISRSAGTLLSELSLHAPVAVISGRSLSDLRRRVGFQPQYLIGNHGLEGLKEQPSELSRARRISRAWKASLEGSMKAAAADGIRIEDKTYSIAIHYRNSRTKKVAKNEVLRAISSLDPKPRVILGKCVANVLPYGAPHKGFAMLELMRRGGYQAGFYIGDDDTDEDVFSLPESGILSVRVGEKRSSQAQYFVRSQPDVSRLISVILRFHRDHDSRRIGAKHARC